MTTRAYASLDEVRTEIDRLDGEIVRLLAARSACVEEVLRFKRTAEDVRAPDRIEQVIARTRALATEHGADPDLVERVYRTMIDGFIAHELRAIAAR